MERNDDMSNEKKPVITFQEGCADPYMYIDDVCVALVEAGQEDMITQALSSLQPAYIYEVDMVDVKVGQKFIRGSGGFEYIMLNAKPELSWLDMKLNSGGGERVKYLCWNIKQRAYCGWYYNDTKVKVAEKPEPKEAPKECDSCSHTYTPKDPNECTVGDLEVGDRCEISGEMFCRCERLEIKLSDGCFLLQDESGSASTVCSKGTLCLHLPKLTVGDLDLGERCVIGTYSVWVVVAEEAPDGFTAMLDLNDPEFISTGKPKHISDKTRCERI